MDPYPAEQRFVKHSSVADIAQHQFKDLFIACGYTVGIVTTIWFSMVMLDRLRRLSGSMQAAGTASGSVSTMGGQE